MRGKRRSPPPALPWPPVRVPLTSTQGRSVLKILLTNDDGIHAPGLWAAAQALSQVGEVCVVAPDREQSGVGASLTLHAPVVARSLEIPALERLSAAANEEAASPDEPQAEIRHRVTAFSVEGTPGDSCILGLEKLVGDGGPGGVRHQPGLQPRLGRHGLRHRGRGLPGLLPRLPDHCHFGGVGAEPPL